MPLACFDAICNVSTHWKHAEGMSLRDDESQIRDSHPLRFMVCFLGVMWMAEGGKMIWGM